MAPPVASAEPAGSRRCAPPSLRSCPSGDPPARYGSEGDYGRPARVRPARLQLLTFAMSRRRNRPWRSSANRPRRGSDSGLVAGQSARGGAGVWLKGSGQSSGPFRGNARGNAEGNELFTRSEGGCKHPPASGWGAPPPAGRRVRPARARARDCDRARRGTAAQSGEPFDYRAERCPRPMGDSDAGRVIVRTRTTRRETRRREAV